LASIVFGATHPEQVRVNVGAVEVFESLDASQRATIDSLT
jgi:aryl-alcohol dehydrogenase-like predicted oxidoreductase